MSKSLAKWAAAALLLTSLLLGPTTVVSHLRATREVVRNELQGMSHDVQEAARIRVLLRDMVGQLLDYQGKIEDVSVRAEAAETAAQRARRELDKQQELLTRAKGLLDEGRPQYQIGGKTYTRQQLCDDANVRLAQSKQLQATLALQDEIGAKLRAAERQGRANLRKAEQLKLERESELKELETRLANAGLLQKVNELAGNLGDDPLGPQTELGEAFAEFRKRTRTAERQADYLAVESNGGLLVDWNAERAGDAEISQAIGQFLAGNSQQ